MDQNDPIEPEEFILRRVPYSQNTPYINPESEEPISTGCFTPSKDDTDGISVFREKFVSAKKVADRYMEGKNKQCYIIRIKAEDLEGIVTIIPSPNEYLDGHAHIPEIKYQDNYVYRPIRAKIIKKLTKENVVHWPEG